MTIEQLLSPAVMEWSKENSHLSKEQSIEEFDKWFADNIDLINESVKDNIDEINESLERGMMGAKLSKLLIESADNEKFNIDLDSMDWDDISSSEYSEEPISGKIESEIDDEEESGPEITDENHVNSDAETKENKDSNTIMTQVKLFEKVRKSNIEECVNQFLQENSNSIKVIDIKYTTPIRTEAPRCGWTAMIIYETL